MVTDNTMSPLDWTILMGRIRTSRMDFIVMTAKNINNIRISPEFTTLIHEDILVTKSRSMDLQPFADPFNRGSLASKSLTILHASVVVGDENPTSLAIETDIVFSSTRILGLYS